MLAPAPRNLDPLLGDNGLTQAVGGQNLCNPARIYDVPVVEHRCYVRTTIFGKPVHVTIASFSCTSSVGRSW